MRVAYNDQDDRAGLRGYVQFNKYTHTHTNTGGLHAVAWNEHIAGPDCAVLRNLIKTHTHTLPGLTKVTNRVSQRFHGVWCKETEPRSILLFYFIFFPGR